MTLMFDARVPVVFGASRDAQDGDAVLAGRFDGSPGHKPKQASGHNVNCACCMGRTPAAQALSRLFIQRARGEVAFSRRVLVDAPAAEASVRAALQSDPMTAARFRLA